MSADPSRIKRAAAWSLLTVFVAGVATGVIGHIVISSVSRSVVVARDKLEMYEDFRQTWWSLAEGFCPNGYRLTGEPTSPRDSHTAIVPNEWYGPDDEFNRGLVLDDDAWKTTQRSLGWVNDPMGYAIVVHIVFTTFDLGRGPLAFPSGNCLTATDGVLPSFRPDWNFVGTRDNLIFFFQIVPAERDYVSDKSSYPREWVAAGIEFIDQLRLFLDGE